MSFLVAMGLASAGYSAPPPPTDDDDLVAPEDDDLVAPEDDDLVAPEDDGDDNATDAARGDDAMDDDAGGYRLRHGIDIVHHRDKILRSGGSVGTIDEGALERLELDDPAQVLTAIPSVQARGEDGYGLRPNIGIRGTSSERSKKVTLMEDGVLFAPAPYAAPAAYYFPLMTRMVGVDVYKGPGAIRYGPHTVGGAVDLRSRPVPYKLELGADLAIGTDLYLKGHGHGGTTHFFDGTAGIGFLIEAAHIQSNGFKDLDGGGDTGFSRSEGAATVRLNSDLDGDVLHTFQARLLWSREDSEETYLGLADQDFEATPYRRYAASAEDRMAWDRISVRADYTLKAGTLDLDVGAAPNDDDNATLWGVDVKVSLYRHAFTRSWKKISGFRAGPDLSTVLANPNVGTNEVYYRILTGESDSASADEALLRTNNDRDYVSMGAQVTATGTLLTGGIRHELELGLRYHFDEITRNHSGDHYLMQAGALSPDGTPRLQLTQNVGDAKAFAAYAQYGLRWRGLSLMPGIRAEVINTRLTPKGGSALSNDTTVFLYGLGAHYEVIDHFGLVFGVHRGFSPVAPGQPDGVDPETSVNWEAGVRYGDATTGSLAEAIFFFNDYDNLSGQCSFSSGCAESALDSQFNAGEVDVFGVEVAAAHSFEVSQVTIPVRLAYTFTQTEFKTAFTSANPQYGTVRVGDELPYVPQHLLSLSAGVAMRRWEATAQLSFASRAREIAGQGDAPDEQLTDAQIDLGLFGRVQLLKSLSVYAKLENLLLRDQLISRRPYGARPARPLSAQLGVKLDY